ncbi:hypothetical protein HYQ46_013187 [Verticillium longisporum]|nr:hypothetical protein HYQ46_013187 [Verticillium longisporum]
MAAGFLSTTKVFLDTMASRSLAWAAWSLARISLMAAATSVCGPASSPLPSFSQRVSLGYSARRNEASRGSSREPMGSVV